MGKLLQGCRAGQGADQSVVYDATLQIYGRSAVDKVWTYVSGKRRYFAAQTRQGRPRRIPVYHKRQRR